MTVQQDYLQRLISSTKQYIKEIESIEHSSHYYQVRLPDTMESQKDSNQMINNHLDKVIAQLQVNIATYNLMMGIHSEESTKKAG
tara:strand:- start:254 stop:508 length:255 start_codon:yes stop_codon:yes gene_type:complete